MTEWLKGAELKSLARKVPVYLVKPIKSQGNLVDHCVLRIGGCVLV